MKKQNIIAVIVAILTLPMASMATISTDYAASITAIMGSGNPDGQWTATTDTELNMQLGLRAKQRYSTFTGSDGAGNYTFPANTAWNIEFSVNADANGSGNSMLSSAGYSYWLYIDNVGGINLGTAFNDNSYGTISTANGAGVEGTYASLSATHSIMQNSELHNWLLLGEGGHTFDLVAQDQSGNRIASDEITVNGGYGAVPEPTTIASGALLLIPFAVSGIRKLQSAKSTA